jgi:hypothetical protein
MLFLVVAIASLIPPISADSATITLRPFNKSVGTIEWLSLDEKSRPIDRGVAPAVTKQASDGVPVVYCSATKTAGFLELIVDVGGGQITASAFCTRVVVRGKAVQTTGVDDPRKKQ